MFDDISKPCKACGKDIWSKVLGERVSKQNYCDECLKGGKPWLPNPSPAGVPVNTAFVFGIILGICIALLFVIILFLVI